KGFRTGFRRSVRLCNISIHRAPVPFLRLQTEMTPDDGAGQRLDVQHHFAVLEDADGAGRLADGHGNRGRLSADGGGRPVAGAETFAQRDSFGGYVEVHAGGDDDAVAADNDGAFKLGDVLDLLADAGIADVALFFAVAAERVEIDWPGHLQ